MEGAAAGSGFRESAAVLKTQKALAWTVGLLQTGRHPSAVPGPAFERTWTRISILLVWRKHEEVLLVTRTRPHSILQGAVQVGCG